MMSKQEFRRWRLEPPGQAAPNSFVVGYLKPDTVDRLAQAGQPPGNLGIAVTRGVVAHSLAASKVVRGDRLPEDEFDRIPAILGHPRAVLFELHYGKRRRQPKPTLLYIADSIGVNENRLVKVVIEVVQSVPKAPAYNKLITAGYFNPASHRKSILLDGALD